MEPTALKQTKQATLNDWQTPPWLFNRLQEVFHFEIDGASDGVNNLLYHFKTKEHPLNGYEVGFNRIFVNPPFNTQKDFIINAIKWKPRLYCLLIPFRPETKIWHDFIWPNTTIFVFNKRIQYIHPKTKNEMKGAAFPSCLVFYGDLKEYDLNKLNDLGVWIKTIGE